MQVHKTSSNIKVHAIHAIVGYDRDHAAICALNAVAANLAGTAVPGAEHAAAAASTDARAEPNAATSGGRQATSAGKSHWAQPVLAALVHSKFPSAASSGVGSAVCTEAMPANGVGITAAAPTKPGAGIIATAPTEPGDILEDLTYSFVRGRIGGCERRGGCG